MNALITRFKSKLLWYSCCKEWLFTPVVGEWLTRRRVFGVDGLYVLIGMSGYLSSNFKLWIFLFMVCCGRTGAWSLILPFHFVIIHCRSCCLWMYSVYFRGSKTYTKWYVFSNPGMVRHAIKLVDVVYLFCYICYHVLPYWYVFKLV